MFLSFLKIVEININGDAIRSEQIEIKLGLIQGGVTGPIFFIAYYINEFGEDIQEVHRRNSR